MKTKTFLILILTFTFSVLVLSASSKEPFTVNDMFKLVRVNNPQISPDGKRILFTKSKANWADNKQENYLWLVSADGKEIFKYTSQEGDSSPKWSPDGKYLAFLRGKGDKRQIWMMRSTGGEALQLTNHKSGISAFKWFPDSQHLLFAAPDIKSKEEKERLKKGEDVIYVYEGPNGQSKRGSWSNLWKFCLKSKKEVKLTKEKMIVGDFDISPQGKRVVYTFRRDNTRNTGNLAEIAMLNLADGKITQLTHNQAPERSPTWALDGRRIAYLAPDDQQWKLAQAKIWIMDVNSQKYSLASDKFGGIIHSFKWSPEGDYIIFNGTLRTNSNIFKLEIRSKRIIQLTNKEGSFRFYSLAADGRQAACLFSDYKSPDNIWLLNFSSGEEVKLTDFNPWLKDRMLAQMRLIRWKSKDSLPIEGLLYLPQDYQKGQKIPLILNIHGGPAGVFTNRFRASYHIYASLGFASLCPNVRGSEGYGDKFLQGNLKDIGGGDYWDLMTGVNKVIEEGIADPTKLGLKGWSYGGILGGWTLTKTKRFKAAALGAMVCDWSSEYGMGFNFDVKLWYIGGTPWENSQGYRAKSSLTYIKNVETPVILFHGEQDTTCSIGQSMNYFTYLFELGKPVRFLRFPREPHGFREPRHQWLRMVEEITWMQKYINHLDWKCKRPEEKEVVEKQAVSKEKDQL